MSSRAIMTDTRSQHISRLLIAFLSVFVFSLFMVFPSYAFADGGTTYNELSKNRSGYAQEFTNSVNPWDQGILHSIDDEVAPSNMTTDDAKGYAGGIAGSIANLMFMLAQGLAAFAVVLVVARFAGRGIFSIMFTKDDGSYDNQATERIPRFFLTAEERGGTIKPNWISRMAVETAKYALIALGVFTVLGIIIALFMLFANALSV